MIDKRVASFRDAVADIPHGVSVMIGGFLTPTGYGTSLAEGKETRVIDGKGYVLEMPLHADFALVRAEYADPWGNLTYNTAARNFNPMMASAAKTTIAEVGMMRGGHLDIVVLGAFQVSSGGDIANWATDNEKFPPAVGGAMDLAVGVRKLFVVMRHAT